MNLQPHSVLVIGCGSIGERHLRCFQATTRANVTACESNPALLSTMAKRYGVPTAPDWEAALACGGHTVAIICTPAPLHVPMSRRALELGVHVLVEKPLSHSLAGIDELVALGRSAPGHAAVAYVLHVNPALSAAREFIRDGGIGRVRQASFVSGQPFHKLRPGYDRSYYRDHKMGGGAIQDALTHSANWTESVLGPTDSLLCDAAHLAVPNVEVEDTVHIAARNGEVLVSYALNQFQVPNESVMQFNSERGSVRIEPGRHRWGVLLEGLPEWNWTDLEPGDRDMLFIAQANAFLDQVEGKPRRLCTIEAAAHTVRFNLAALASAQSGRRVSCCDV